MRLSSIISNRLGVALGMIVFCSGAFHVQAATNTVSITDDNGAGSLRAVLASSADGDVINFSVTGTVTVSSELVISNNLTIVGPVSNQVTISGGGTTRVFFIDPGAPGATNLPATGPTVQISHLIIADGMAKGGNGGDNSPSGAGGGAAGMGGALFVNGGALSIAHVIFSGNKALGGDGGSSFGESSVLGGSGGGGFGQDGGTNFDNGSATGGDGGGTGGIGGDLGGLGGVGGTYNPVLSGTAGGNGQEGGGGGGGGGSTEETADRGGDGGFGAGGGGGGYSPEVGGAGGNGGFGGGGGGGGYGASLGNGGSLGTFGGKGGDASNGNGGDGGGGAGLGGAIFVRQGSLSLLYATFTNNAAQGGSEGAGSPAGDPGQGKGGAIFIGVSANVCTNTGCIFSGNSAADATNAPGDNNDYYGTLMACPNHPPVAVCTNITVEVSSNSCSVEGPGISVDGGSYDPDEDPIMIEQDPPGPYNLGLNPVTLIVQDIHGAMDTCPAYINVVDKIPPVPVTASLMTNIEQCMGFVSPPFANDNCGGLIEGFTFDPTTYMQQGTFTVHWVYIDMSLNSTTQDQVVIVHDTMPPEPEMNPLPTITGQCMVSGVSPPAASDNCGLGPIEGMTTDPLIYTNQGSYTIHWIYDDMHGNTSTQLQSVVIKDTIPPMLSPCPPDITRGPLPGQCGVTVTYPLPSATDICGTPIVVCTPPSGSVFAYGTNKVTCVATDVGSNMSSCAFSVIITQAPECSISVSGTPNGLPTVCQGQSVILTAANGMKHYSWTGPEQTGASVQTIVVTTPGTYFCSEEQYYGPTNCCSVTVTVNPPPPCNITGNLLITNGLPTTLVGPDGMASQYWTGPQNNGLASRSNTVIVAGTYTLHLVDSNGCQNACPVTVLNQTPSPCSITASGDSGNLTICQGGSTILTGANGMSSYLWSGPEQNGATAKSIRVGTQGMYSVRQIDGAGLTNTCSVFLSVHPLPAINIFGIRTICQGSNTTLSGPSGMSHYLWLGPQHNGFTTQSNTVSIAGTYTLQITDSNGCQNSQAIPVTTVPCP